MTQAGDRIEVVSAAIVRDGRVLMLQRTPKPGWPTLDYVFATPGGKVESGEDHRTALLRELEEELGLRIARVGATVYSVDVDPPSIARHVHLTCYRVEWSDVVGLPMALDGAVGFAWLDARGLTCLALAPADTLGMDELLATLYS